MEVNCRFWLRMEDENFYNKTVEKNLAHLWNTNFYRELWMGSLAAQRSLKLNTVGKHDWDLTRNFTPPSENIKCLKQLYFATIAWSIGSSKNNHRCWCHPCKNVFESLFFFTSHNAEAVCMQRGWLFTHCYRVVGWCFVCPTLKMHTCLAPRLALFTVATNRCIHLY